MRVGDSGGGGRGLYVTKKSGMVASHLRFAGTTKPYIGRGLGLGREGTVMTGRTTDKAEISA